MQEHRTEARRYLARIGGASVLLACGELATASIVWNGPTMGFAKADFADPTLAASQDRITSNVWITRGDTRGLYNAATEPFFAHLSSPSGTRWADGTLGSYSELVYSDWETWATSRLGGPPATIGVPAVVHLLADDIYMSITFTSWTAAGGGGFSYQRSTLPGPASLAALGLGGLWTIRRRRI